MIGISAIGFAIYHFYLELYYGKKSIAAVYSIVSLGVGVMCGILYPIYGLCAPIIFDLLSIYAVDGYFATQLSKSKNQISLLQNTLFWLLLCIMILLAYLALPNLNDTDELNLIILIGLVTGFLISLSQDSVFFSHFGYPS
jgi:hypothetical protein